jgi:pimeloyl-ACP methyl ester carboxylesterase
LFELLDKSRETGPFILVGHSFGVTESIEFAKRYPELVAGVVSLDGTSPAFYKGRKDLYKQNIVASSLLRFLSFTGLLRVISNLGLFTTTGESTPKEIVRVTNMMTYNRVYSKEAVGEVMALIDGNVEKGTLGDIPVLVLTADNEKLKKKQPEMYQDFVNSQTDLLALSTRSQQKIIKDADHFFPIKMPDVVTDELQSFLDAYAAKA